MFRLLIFITFCLFGIEQQDSQSAAIPATSDPEFLMFTLNGSQFKPSFGITPRPLEPSDDPEVTAQQAIEESSLFLQDQAWVQVIRQDDPWTPNHGIGIGFSYPADNDTFPYTPEKVAIQFKNFQFGGQHFSKADTANFSGVFNNFSADIKLQITDFKQDTITGNFSGVLISGSGRMAHLEAGQFKIRLYIK